MFGPIGMPELLIILTLALIIFGPRKLPELGRSLARVSASSSAPPTSCGTLWTRKSASKRSAARARSARRSQLSQRPPPPLRQRPTRARTEQHLRVRTRIARWRPFRPLERPLPQSARDDDDRSLIELTDPQEVELDAGRMSFLEHLDELRKRLIASLIGIVIGCVVAFIFLDKYIFPFVMVPMTRMLPDGGKLITTEASEFFMLWIKTGFFAGLLVAMPFILYQVWLFVALGVLARKAP